MFELFTSDAAILLFSCAGLALTAVSILRDTRAVHERQLVIAESPPHADDVCQIVTEDGRADAA